MVNFSRIEPVVYQKSPFVPFTKSYLIYFRQDDSFTLHDVNDAQVFFLLVVNQLRKNDA